MAPSNLLRINELRQSSSGVVPSWGIASLSRSCRALPCCQIVSREHLSVGTR